MPSIAEQIGQPRIFAVVDRFYDRIQSHPTLSIPFQRVQDWPRHKERIAYFWWVSLGGDRTRDFTFAVAPKHWQAGFNEMLLGDWKTLFREVVSSTLPSDLAAAWMERVDHVGASLVIANENFGERSGQAGLEIVG